MIEKTFYLFYLRILFIFYTLNLQKQRRNKNKAFRCWNQSWDATAVSVLSPGCSENQGFKQQGVEESGSSRQSHSARQTHKSRPWEESLWEDNWSSSEAKRSCSLTKEVAQHGNRMSFCYFSNYSSNMTRDVINQFVMPLQQLCFTVYNLKHDRVTYNRLVTS